MKRTALFLLFLLLLMTSCKTNVTDTRSPNEFYLEALPEIGEFTGKASTDMFDENSGYDFIPSDEYGEIIPYIGTYRLYETPPEEGSDWHAEVGYCSYGFCTPNGKIVMPASDKNSYLNYRNTDDGFGFYTLTREIQPVADAPDEFIPGETYIIPRDGSWCLKLSEGSWVTSSGNGYINICDYPTDGGTVKLLMYDYNGNLVHTFEGVDSMGMYSNGLMLISDWTDNGYSAEFVNKDGERVLGPFSTASDFNEHGITAVQDENGFYLIDTNGEHLTDYYESIFKEFSGENDKRMIFSANHMDNHKVHDVFDEKGDFIATVDANTYFSVRFPDNGEIYYFYTKYDENDKGYAVYNTEKMVWKRVSDGTDFVSKEFGVSPNSYAGSDNCYVHIDKENGVGFFFDCNGETIAVIDGVTDVMNVTDNGEYIIYQTGTYDYGYDELTGENKVTDTRKIFIYDSEKKKNIFSLDSGGSGYFPDKNKRYIIISVYDETDFFGGTTNYWLYDTKNDKMLFENCKQISFYDMGDRCYFNVCTENSSAVYDDNMKLIRKSYFD